MAYSRQEMTAAARRVGKIDMRFDEEFILNSFYQASNPDYA
jgi:hypothetical protein